MRTPTSNADAYSWWLAAINGEIGKITTEPKCGYYKTRFVKDGPWVPVRIFLVQEIDPETSELASDERTECRVDGKKRNAEEMWLRCADHPIDRDEFRFMCATVEWAEKHSRSDPTVNPRKKIDPVFQPLHTFEGKKK